jgi:tRNA threonylcarbamoyl adenosine modification protein YeaZ
MRVLAIDCALGACAAAVFESAAGIVVASQTRIMLRGHAEALMPLIARVMDEAEVEFQELDRIAVTVGPGSFTGLRVGISAARGIALAAAKPAIGLTTLAGLAAPHIAEDDTTLVVAAIDARHDHVYMQVFGPGGRTLLAPRLAPLREAVRAATSGPARIVGSAAGLIARSWPKGEPPPALVDQRAAPDIAWIARLGAAAADADGPPRPFYLRAPDAQPQAAARLPRR